MFVLFTLEAAARITVAFTATGTGAEPGHVLGRR